ncbi:MAG TPA: Asp-tRNA(Asn)/Glu-tRNA(Gln) amidotransferase subunit GatC [Gemmatimonadota bacterium]|nr:Asp-tRNA(Asn)/Glu-tRNA(Gln) amidotransferase subunit GatC [Gemmatimonadota bacterium]
MTISAHDVRHIARLARLELSDEEVERFRGELSKILEYVAQLDRVEADSAAEPEEPDQPLRPDVPARWPDVTPLHAEAPDFEDGFYRVPRVVE